MISSRASTARRKSTYDLPELEEILSETWGVILYQEQVMQIANRLAGFSLGDADLLRRAMGKKKHEEMAAQREKFLTGCAARKVPQKKAEKIFDLMAEFAGYGFNKSHSCAYALLAYQTAWLKTHYPVEFMAAMLTSETGNTEKVVKYINEARSMGITVLPPDVNSSAMNFTPVGDQIRFGLVRDQERGREHGEGNSGGARDARPLHERFRILRIGRYAPAEQARARKPDSRWRDGRAGRASRADDCGDRSRDGTSAEIAARARSRPAWAVRRGLGGVHSDAAGGACPSGGMAGARIAGARNTRRSGFIFPAIRSISTRGG